MKNVKKILLLISFGIITVLLTACSGSSGGGSSSSTTGTSGDSSTTDTVTVSTPSAFTATSQLTREGWQFGVNNPELDKGSVSMAVHREGSAVGDFNSSSFYLPATGTYTLVATNALGSTSTVPQRLAPTAITPAISFASSQALSISWAHDVQASSYTLYRLTTSGAVAVLSTNNIHTLDNLAAAPAQISVADNIALAVATTYTYQLIAHNISGSATSTASYRTISSAPSSFTVTSLLTRSGWKFNVNNPEFDNGSVALAVHRDGSAVGTFSSSTFYTPLGSYTFVATNLVGSTTAVPERLAPTAITPFFSAVSSQQLSISWAHDVQASSYTLYRSVNGATTELKSISNPHSLDNLAAAPAQLSAADDLTLVPATTYTYQLIAHNISGNSTGSLDYRSPVKLTAKAFTLHITGTQATLSHPTAAIGNINLIARMEQNSSVVSTIYGQESATDIALYKQATQSSTFGDNEASRAVNQFSDDKAQTLPGVAGYWQLDLGNSYRIVRLRIASFQEDDSYRVRFSNSSNMRDALYDNLHRVNHSWSEATDFNRLDARYLRIDDNDGVVLDEVQIFSIHLPNSTASTSFNLAGSDQPYTLLISDIYGSSTLTPSVSVVPTAEVLSAVKVRLSWQHNYTHVSSYAVYDNDNNELYNSAAPANLAMVTVESTVTQLIANTTYTYQVATITADGQRSTASVAFKTPQAVPFNASISQRVTTAGQVVEYNVTNWQEAKQLSIYRDGAFYKGIPLTQGTGSVTLPTTGSYTFGGIVGFSSAGPIAATIPAPGLSIPTLVIDSSKQISISWTHDVQASSYTLYRSVNTGAAALLTSTNNLHTLENITAAPTQVTVVDSFALVPDTTYSYQLVAHNAGGNTTATAVSITAPPRLDWTKFSVNIVGNTAIVSHPSSAVGYIYLTGTLQQSGAITHTVYSNELRNVALNQPAQKNGKDFNGAPGNAVDGNYDSYMHTIELNASHSPHWQVDWQKAYSIRQVRVKEGISYNLSIKLRDSSGAVVHDFSYSQNFSSVGQWHSSSVAAGTFAQKLELSTDNGDLVLHEVEVYGALIPGNAQASKLTLSNSDSAYQLHLGDLYHSSTIAATVTAQPVMEVLSPSSVSLTWEHYMSMVERYEVYDQENNLAKTLDSPTDSTQVAMLDLTATATPLTGNTTHTFSVVTILDSGERATATVSAYVPSAPADITVTDNGVANKVLLNLQQTAGNATLVVQRHTATATEGVSTQVIEFDSTGESNVALNKPTLSYPSEDATYRAARGVDGSKTRLEVHGSENGSYWQVDLQGNFAVKEVRFFNRTDCCTDRNEFLYLATDADFNNIVATMNLNTDAQQNAQMNGVIARYARVQARADAPFNFSEVEVFVTFMAGERTRFVNIDDSSSYTFTLSNIMGSVSVTRSADGTVVTNSVD